MRTLLLLLISITLGGCALPKDESRAFVDSGLIPLAGIGKSETMRDLLNAAVGKQDNHRQATRP